MWASEQRSGFWYTVQAGRIPTIILRHSFEHADETAAALNRIDRYYDETVPDNLNPPELL